MNARELPWRVPPAAGKNGVRADPYRVWLSEVMLQQTTVVVVTEYFHKFTKRWPDVHALAQAADADVMAEWAGLGYYARARNLLKCARVISADYGGAFPSNETELQKLPGIGPYTSAAIAAIAFDRPATVLDGNVERVMARLFAIENPLPDSKEQLRELAAKLTPSRRSGDYAQSVMDLGATVCKPRSSSCGICPLSDDCLAREKKLVAELPKKRPKPAKPVRRGVAYFVMREDNAILMETRPEKGLLGGMRAFPSTEWSVEAPSPNTPLAGKWSVAPQTVRHTFTHFHLLLDIHTCRVHHDAQPSRGEFVPKAKVNPQHLPSVMRKALIVGLGEFEGSEKQLNRNTNV